MKETLYCHQFASDGKFRRANKFHIQVWILSRRSAISQMNRFSAGANIYVILCIEIEMAGKRQRDRNFPTGSQTPVTRIKASLGTANRLEPRWSCGLAISRVCGMLNAFMSKSALYREHRPRPSVSRSCNWNVTSFNLQDIMFHSELSISSGHESTVFHLTLRLRRQLPRFSYGRDRSWYLRRVYSALNSVREFQFTNFN